MNRKIKLSLTFLLFTFFLFPLGCRNKSTEQKQRETYLTIRLVHGLEVASYLNSAREQFVSLDPVLADGRKVRLELIPERSLRAAHRISSGELKTEAWLAPSTSLVNLVNTELSNLGPKQVDCKQIFATPVVIATEDKNNEFFGATEKTFSWNEFFDTKITASLDQKTKNNYIAFAHSDPTLSAAGLASVIELSHLATAHIEKTLDLDSLTEEKTISRLKRFENSAFNYGASDQYLLERAAASGANRVRFVVTTEHELAMYNSKRDAGTPLLTALYPSEGSYWEDYSFCTSDADWVTPAHRSAIKLLLDHLSSQPAQYAAKKNGYRPSISQFDDVEPLTEKFGITTTLPATSLNPAPGNVVSYLEKHWINFMRPAAVTLVLDTSGSMSGASLYAAKDGLRRIIAIAGTNSKKALFTFASEPHLLVDFTEDPQKIMPALDTITAVGGSAIYDTIKNAIEVVTSEKISSYRKIVIIVTDGDDKNSLLSLPRLLELVSDKCSTHDVNLTILGIQRVGADYSDLKKIAKAARGVFREVNTQDPGNTWEEVYKGI